VGGQNSAIVGFAYTPSRFRNKIQAISDDLIRQFATQGTSCSTPAKDVKSDASNCQFGKDSE
jgi:hypothetical protein